MKEKLKPLSKEETQKLIDRLEEEERRMYSSGNLMTNEEFCEYMIDKSQKIGKKRSQKNDVD